MRGLRVLWILAAAAVAALALTAGQAAADGNGATIRKDFGCRIALHGFFAFTSDLTIEVDTVSGNTTLTCHFRADDFTSSLPTETEQFSGFRCGTLEGLTHDSFAVVNKAGNGLLRCQIKANAA